MADVSIRDIESHGTDFTDGGGQRSRSDLGQVIMEDRHGPTSLAQYWKLDPWNQGYVVALEAESDVSQVKGQANPYQKRSHNGGQWRTGHLSGRLAGTEPS